MKQLFTGIYSKFNTGTNTLKTNLTGGLHLIEAPQGTATPYGVYSLVSNIHDWDFAVDYDESLIQFDLYDEAQSATTICNLYDYLKTLYDDCSLTVTGHTPYYMWRDFSRLLRDPVPGVWHYVIQYRLMMRVN